MLYPRIKPIYSNRGSLGFSSRGDYKTEMITETRLGSCSYDKKNVTNYQGIATKEPET